MKYKYGWLSGAVVHTVASGPEESVSGMRNHRTQNADRNCSNKKVKPIPTEAK